MDDNSNDFRTVMIERVEATHPEPSAHPCADRWLAYQRGELAADAEAELQDHLVRCRDCFELAQAAAAFAEPADTAGSDAEGDEDRWREEWHRLRGRLRALEGAAASPVPRLAERLRRRGRFPYALAAALFLALLGSTAWNLRQQSALAALRAPRPNAPIFDFFGEERRAPAERVLAAGSGPWMLVFHPGDERAVYRLAIRDAATGRALASQELRPDADLALTLDLPEGLPAGRYRLQLSADGRLLEEHLLRVTETGRGG